MNDPLDRPRADLKQIIEANKLLIITLSAKPALQIIDLRRAVEQLIRQQGTIAQAVLDITED